MRYNARRRGKGSIFFTLFILLAAAAAWGYGLTQYVASMPRKVANPAAVTDAIVVLTGGSGRLREAIDLLEAGKAKRLFISGVYQGVEVAELLKLYESNSDLRCCIDVGHEAESTGQNAAETAKWLEGRDIRSIRLVTASYHMRRSLVEFQYRLPDLAIVQHPVFPETVILLNWWKWPGTLELLAEEYNKYLMARLRIGVERAWAALKEQIP
ncbi:MAG: YdcF family protein [Magnetospiraceae bacterium]